MANLLSCNLSFRRLEVKVNWRDNQNNEGDTSSSNNTFANKLKVCWDALNVRLYLRAKIYLFVCYRDLHSQVYKQGTRNCILHSASRRVAFNLSFPISEKVDVNSNNTHKQTNK